MGHKKRKHYRTPYLITLFFALLTVLNPPIFDEFIETLLVDYRFKVRNLLHSPEIPDEIVIVTIDEQSLSEYGRWPWDRKVQAALIGKILEGKPKVLGIDIFYSETESAEQDDALAALFQKNRDHLVNALGCEVEKGRDFEGEVEDPIFDTAVSRVKNLKLLHPIESCRVLLPPDPIASSVTFGHVYALPDRDGKLRWEPLYLKYGDEFIPSFSLQVARIALGLPAKSITIVGGEGVRLGNREIPTDAFGRLHINYYGKEESFPYHSAASILSGRVNPKIFRDKVVFLGTSAISTYDMRVSPFSANMAGVEKNATVVANILQDNFIRRAPIWIDLLMILLTGGLAALLLRKTRAIVSFLLFLLILAVLLVLNQFAFSVYGIRSNLLFPLLTLFTQGIYVISHRYLLEERRAGNIRKMFSSYVTERVVDELIRNPELAKLGGERREVTILFSDVIGFTNFSEMNEPEVVVAMLNEYLEAMTEIVFQWEGTLDKFIGDAMMVFWGAPLEQRDHGERAIRCTLHMFQRLGELQKKWEGEGKEPLKIGIGINSGEVLVGNIGAEGKKMDYTVIGDHVNLASRVESLTRKYNAKILITEYTLEKIRDLIEGGQLGHLCVCGLERVVVKGKEKSVGIFELSSGAHGAESTLSSCKIEVVHLKEK